MGIGDYDGDLSGHGSEQRPNVDSDFECMYRCNGEKPVNYPLWKGMFISHLVISALYGNARRGGRE